MVSMPRRRRRNRRRNHSSSCHWLVALVVTLVTATTLTWWFVWWWRMATTSHEMFGFRTMSTTVHQDYGAALRATFVTTTTTTTSSSNNNNNYKAIRRWGCTARHETPLIFVHIGKAGGGSVRARFAAAAVGYKRGRRWKSNEDRRAYYRIIITSRPLGGNHSTSNGTTSTTSTTTTTTTTTNHERAYFCDSAFKHGRFNATTTTFEGTRPCAATTPLGIAVACPQPVEHFDKCLACGIHDVTCHRLYTGHNLLGNEMHWLPPRYLLTWWKKLQDKQPSISSLEESSWPNTKTLQLHAELTQSLQLIKPGNTDWCPSLLQQQQPQQQPQPQPGRFQNDEELEMHYANCSLPLAERIDELARQWNNMQTSLSTSQQHSAHDQAWMVDKHEPSAISSSSSAASAAAPAPAAASIPHWGPLYASLPVLRTTIVRDPFSWALSKFFWHELESIHNCSNVTAATAHVHDATWATRPNHDERPGWAHRMARIFILQLCGEDCQIRWDKAAAVDNLSAAQEQALLESFERQADYNLRHAFVVVGRIDDMDGFYDMVSRRVQYLPTITSSERFLGKTVARQRHASGASKACQQVFSDANFRRQMIQASPAIAILHRLYQTALRVNAFQKQELETCVLVGK